MKRSLLSVFCVFTLSLPLFPQLTLESCQHEARENYPLIVQYDLIEKAKEYNLGNASKGYLPQFSLTARATYQSDVTKLPVELPNVSIKALPKDQYQVMLELQQNIWDGGNIRSRKEIVRSGADVERERVNVDIYTLNERVNQVYFGILLLDEQLLQNQLLQDDLQRSYLQVSAYMQNGIANQSDLDAIKVEQLNTKQRKTELTVAREAYYQMLSLLTGKQVSPDARLTKPSDAESTISSVINRPELFWFDAQNESLRAQEDALQTHYLPKLGLFVQGAYGNPGLNMLKNEFSPFYIAGVRLSWNFGSLYTLRNDKRLIENNRQRLMSNRNIFIFNTQLQATQEGNSIRSLQNLMKEDDEIITLRKNIRKAAEVKVANGTLTVTEMLREITAENMARQTKALHEIQLLMNIYQLKYTTNN